MLLPVEPLRPTAHDHRRALDVLSAARDGKAAWLLNGHYNQNVYNEFRHHGETVTVKFDLRNGAMNFSAYDPSWSYTIRPGDAGYGPLAEIALEIVERYGSGELSPRESATSWAFVPAA